MSEASIGKDDIAAAIAGALPDDIKKKKAVAEAATDAVFGAVVSALQAGKHVRLNGIGTLKPKAVKPRKGHNPKTGETIDIAGHNTAAFAPAKGLKDALNA